MKKRARGKGRIIGKLDVAFLPYSGGRKRVAFDTVALFLRYSRSLIFSLVLYEPLDKDTVIKFDEINRDEQS